MRFLPIHRWQGGLLGSFVGEWLPEFNTDAPSILAYLQIGQHITKDWIEKRQLSEQDWLNLKQQYFSELNICRSGDLILALLPLILFEHDSQRELEQHLGLVQTLWQQPTETINDVRVWGYLSSLILTEQLQPQRWLDDVIQIAHTRQTPLKKLLKLVKTLLEDAVPLHQSIKQLSREATSNQLAIALSIYCFGSTLDDVRLSIFRASQTQNSLVLALTGFLVGIYNSINGFPVAWRLANQNCPSTQFISQQAIQLFAVWSGVYEIKANSPLPTFPIAASGVIQRRTSLNIVSQDRD